MLANGWSPTMVGAWVILFACAFLLPHGRNQFRANMA